MRDRNANKGMPLYRQILQALEAAVFSGELAPGARLASERDLARQHGVNRSTVIRALEEMTERGMLIRKRGSGTYVTREKWGVQSYARLNWQEPPPLLPAIRNSPFHREAERLRQVAARGGSIPQDLSRDGLAPDLLPQIALSDLSWDEIIRAEQGEEAATLGLPRLRQGVARFLQEHSRLAISPEQILITSGSRQGIFLITQCLLKAGDAVGVEAPSYFYSLPVFQAAGLRLYALPMDREGITPDGLKNLLARKPVKMIFLNPMFHNPTGTVMSETRKKAVLAACAAARVPVVEDDAYSLLHFSSPAAPLKALDTEDQVIYLGSLSSYAGGNIRAGWLAAPSGIIARLASARHMMDAGLSVLPQILAGEYLEQVAPRHLPLLRAALAARAEALARFLTATFGARLCFETPPGGLYIYAAMQETDPKNRPATVQEFLRQGIIPAPGEDFGDARPAFRMNFSFFR